MRLLFPLPFGLPCKARSPYNEPISEFSLITYPMTAVKSLKGPMDCAPRYDLKFSTAIRSMRP